MNKKLQLINAICNNAELNNILTDTLYLYKYNILNDSDVNDLLKLYNVINETTYTIAALNKNLLEVINSDKQFIKIELIIED